MLGYFTLLLMLSFVLFLVSSSWFLIAVSFFLDSLMHCCMILWGSFSWCLCLWRCSRFDLNACCSIQLFMLLVFFSCRSALVLLMITLIWFCFRKQRLGNLLMLCGSMDQRKSGILWGHWLSKDSHTIALTVILPIWDYGDFLRVDNLLHWPFFCSFSVLYFLLAWKEGFYGTYIWFVPFTSYWIIEGQISAKNFSI